MGIGNLGTSFDKDWHNNLPSKQQRQVSTGRRDMVKNQPGSAKFMSNRHTSGKSQLLKRYNRRTH